MISSTVLALLSIGTVMFFLTQRPVAFAVAREVERHVRDVLAQGVLPNVEFGPRQQRMHAQMRAVRHARLIVAPEFRRLLFHIPRPVHAARTEDAFFGAHRLFVAANADHHRIELLLAQHGAQAFGLARGRTRRRRQRLIDRTLGRALLREVVEVPLGDVLIAERVDFRQFHVRFEQDERKRDAAEKRLARHPQQRRAVLADRPQHARLAARAIGLAQNRDGFRLQAVESVHECVPSGSGLVAFRRASSADRIRVRVMAATASAAANVNAPARLSSL